MYSIQYVSESGRIYTHSSNSGKAIANLIRECHLSKFWSVGEKVFNMDEARAGKLG